MTRDDIDDLMRDNGITVVGEAVYALCQIVAAHEREACAKVCEQIFYDLAKDNSVDSTAVANLICNFGDFVGKPLIEAIRARGEQ